MVYDGVTTAGPCSTNYDQLVGRDPREKYTLGLACDIRLRDDRDVVPCLAAAAGLGLEARKKEGTVNELKISVQ